MAKQTGSHATHLWVFYKDVKLYLSVLLGFRDSYFQEHVTVATLESIWQYALGIRAFLQKEYCWACLFLDTKYPSSKVIKSS